MKLDELRVAYRASSAKAHWEAEDWKGTLDKADAYIAALAAENKELRCCGNCKRLGSIYGPAVCVTLVSGGEYVGTCGPGDHCHLAPSRWTKRDEEARRDA